MSEWYKKWANDMINTKWMSWMRTYVILGNNIIRIWGNKIREWVNNIKVSLCDESLKCEAKFEISWVLSFQSDNKLYPCVEKRVKNHF